MLNAEMNARLTQVGTGTPCGELMRRYWIPFFAAAKLDEDPVQKVRVLGEDLTLYRDKSGQLGLIGERCLHRSVELQYGIPDDDGIRCPYHGWKFDHTGACIDTPLEAADSHFKEKLHITAYPVQEMGGLLFAYMGPQPAPLLPRWEFFVWPNAVRQIGLAYLNCNWLQCQENTGDPLHGIYLHGYLFKYQLEKMKAPQERIDQITAEVNGGRATNMRGIKGLYASPTEYGMKKGVIYSKELGAARDYVSKVATVVFPFYTQLGSGGTPRGEYQIRVPIDDTHTLHISYGCYCAPPGVEAPEQDSVPYYEVPIWDEQGRPILDCILNQDFIGWWSQGPVTDRSKEKLARSDVPIIFLRRQLDQQIRIVEEGGEPLNVFRDPASTPDILYGDGVPPEDWTAPDWARRFADSVRNSPGTGQYTRANYHKGYNLDRESDRYGPATDLVKELHRRIEVAGQEALAGLGDNPPS